jgi:hypothetical protein
MGEVIILRINLAIPLIDAALNEDREVLKDLWTKLLAASMDPLTALTVHSHQIVVAAASDDAVADR